MIKDIEKPVASFNFVLKDLSLKQEEFYEYWLKIEGNRAMPMRADFNPMDIHTVAPFLSLEDVIYDPLRFQVRLVGGSTSSARDSKGQYLDEIPGTDAIIEMLSQMVERKKPYHYISMITWDERKHKTYSSLVVPFSEDGERVSICMACHHTLEIL